MTFHFGSVAFYIRCSQMQPMDVVFCPGHVAAAAGSLCTSQHDEHMQSALRTRHLPHAQALNASR
jgi:hypothetical protein